MNILGQYAVTTIKELKPGKIFTLSQYNRASPLCCIAIKATSPEGKEGAVILDAYKFDERRQEDSGEKIHAFFFPNEDLKDTPILDLTNTAAILPNLNAIVNHYSLGRDIPNGSLVIKNEGVFLVASSGHQYSYVKNLVNAKTGTMERLTERDEAHACICLRWEILAHAGTLSQKTLYAYPAKSAQTTTH